jgi:uncharacterized protein (DUF362 family)
MPLAGRLLAAHVVTPEHGLVIASADPVAAEAAALAFLTHLYQTQTPREAKLMQKLLIIANGSTKELGTEPIADNRFIKHAVVLGLGQVPSLDILDAVA